jgi:hypothetical protein
MGFHVGDELTQRRHRQVRVRGQEHGAWRLPTVSSV